MNNQKSILLDLDKDLREAEGCLRCGGLRYMDSIRDHLWFNCMEELGFLKNDRFIPIIDMIAIADKFDAKKRWAMLEAVGCGLSEVTL